MRHHKSSNGVFFSLLLPEYRLSLASLAARATGTASAWLYHSRRQPWRLTHSPGV